MSLLRRLQAYWLMIHPFPVMMVVALATILAIATARDALDLSRLARAIGALFFSQVVVGTSNDLHDRVLDAQGQPWKPIVRGIVTPNEARVNIAVAFVLMLVFGISLGWIALLLVLLGTLAGQLYNYWLRDTPFSWLPYVIGFITLPIYVWIVMQRFDARQFVLVPIGLPLLFGVHLAQTLPDTETDIAVGVRGFAVTLGRTRGVIVVWSTMIGAQIVTLVSAIVLQLNLEIVGAAVAISLALVVASMWLYHRQPTSNTLRVVFHLIAPSAVVLIAGWLMAL
ncbi:MAG: UbiA family prenyltransferase [Chloroflexi bacterium]|nr:UbiA family prenyltransferase [Chloroflexota bacterium]